MTERFVKGAKYMIIGNGGAASAIALYMGNNKWQYLSGAHLPIVVDPDYHTISRLYQ